MLVQSLLLVSFLLLFNGRINFLLSLERIRSCATRIAAAESHDDVLRDTSAWDAKAAKVKTVSRDPARVDLVGAADAAPAHCVVVIVATLDGAASALVMNENAANHLLLFVGVTHSAAHF